MKNVRVAIRGSLLVPMILLVLVLVPVVLVFARWMLVHRKLEMRARVHGRQYFAAEGATEVALRRLDTDRPSWRSGMSKTYEVHVDTATVVEINVSSLGS